MFRSIEETTVYLSNQLATLLVHPEEEPSSHAQKQLVRGRDYH